MALSPPHSPAVIVNRPENVTKDRALNHVLCFFWNVPDGPQRFESSGQWADPGPSQGPSRISSAPSRYIREPQRLEDQFLYRQGLPAVLLSSTNQRTQRVSTPCWKLPLLLGHLLAISALPLLWALLAAISFSSVI